MIEWNGLGTDRQADLVYTTGNCALSATLYVATSIIKTQCLQGVDGLASGGRESHRGDMG